MDNQVYILSNEAYLIQQAIPQSASGDDVQIEVYNVTDSSVEQAFTAMTFVRNGVWSYSFTPTDTDVYLVTIRDNTLQVDFFKYLKSTGALIGSPSGSTQGDTLTTLRKEFLLSIDQWNSDEDLTADGTSGDQAKRALNLALQKIYNELKNARYMESNPSTSLVSTASQDYIELSAISDLDDIVSLTEGTNDRKLVCIPFWKYREITPDPSEVTGVPSVYARLFNRIYLSPRPDSAITYTCDYIKRIASLSAESDRSGLPSSYNYWIFAEAVVFWQMMEDRTNSAGLQAAMLHASNMREVALRAISAQFDEDSVSESHWGRLGVDIGGPPQFQSPVNP